MITDTDVETLPDVAYTQLSSGAESSRLTEYR